MRKFGIELEVSGISKEQAAEALSVAGVEAVAENYNHRTRNYWKVTTDSSITSDNGLACEIVSPILNYREETFCTISKVVAALKEVGATVNETCGMHVHVDCRGINDPDFYRLLLTFYSKYESEIDEFVDSNRRDNGNTYCRTNKSLYDNWDRLWSSYSDVAPTFLADIFSTLERYYKLNFASYVRHGTVEFRQFQGTLDEKKIRAWCDFCVNLVEKTAAYCASSSTKTKLRPKKEKPSNFVTPQIHHYIVATAKNMVANAELDIQVSDPYQSLMVFKSFPINPVIRNRIIDDVVTVDYSNEEINDVFKTIFYCCYEVALRTMQTNRYAMDNPNDQNIPLRDPGFVLDSSFHVLITAIFFGFTGTLAEVTRKAISKLTNLNILVNGHIIQDEDFQTFFSYLVDTSNGPAQGLSRNRFYKTFFGRHNNIMKQSRKSAISRYANEFIKNTKRFFVSNPRGLRNVTSGEFATRKTNTCSEVLGFLLQSKYTIDYWGLEEELPYHSSLSDDITNFDIREHMDANRATIDSIWSSITPIPIFSSLNTESDFDVISKQPYFDFVDAIRQDKQISDTFVGLSDTEKVIPIRGIPNPEVWAKDAIDRVRAFVSERAIQAERHTRVNTRGPERVFTNIQSEYHEIINMIDTVCNAALQNNQIMLLRRIMTNTRAVNEREIQDGLASLEVAMEQLIQLQQRNANNIILQEESIVL